MKKLLTLIFVLGQSLPALAEEKTLVCNGKWKDGESWEKNITFDPEIETIEGHKDGEKSQDNKKLYFIDKTRMGWLDISGKSYFETKVSRFDGALTVSNLDRESILLSAKCVLFKQAF